LWVILCWGSISSKRFPYDLNSSYERALARNHAFKWSE